MIQSLQETELAVVRGVAAGRFFRDLRNPRTLAAYRDFTELKEGQLAAVAAVIGHAAPDVRMFAACGEDSLLRAEARLACDLSETLDECDDPPVRVALAQILRMQLRALSYLARL